MNRRQFTANLGLSFLCLSAFPKHALANAISQAVFVSNRPTKADRTYSSESIEQELQTVKAQIADPELAWMFENCYPNTLDTTVDFEYIDGQPDTFIITGDIEAMWLRDSTAQVWPYMPHVTSNQAIRELVKGLIKRQIKCVITDPYANAFYKDVTKVSYWQSDEPTPIPGVHERKWEIDSLCYVIRLIAEYYRLTQDRSIFDAQFDQAMQLIVKVFETEQVKDGQSPYYFKRVTDRMTDAPILEGTGRPVNPVGLIRSLFRPSDDASLYPFLIPSNIFAVISLRQLSDIYQDIGRSTSFAQRCINLATEVDQAIQKYGIAEHLHFGKIYAYEVDGFGNKLFMDDANVPSLMSLAYLDSRLINDPIYQNTRRFLVSDHNPYYFKGKFAEGQASPHTGKKSIWPMGIILRAMTSQDDTEIKNCLSMLKRTHAGTGFMHESLNKDDPSDYSRDWFAWANTLFGELIVKLYAERPHLLSQSF